MFHQLSALILLSSACFAQQLQSYVDTNDWSRVTKISGVSGRPFITDFVVDRSGVKETVFSGLTSASSSPPANWESTAGRLTVAIAPTNLCSAGQTPQTAMCYDIPNRVAFNVMCTTGNGGSSVNFAANSSATNACNVNQNTIFELTINMNTFTDSFQWSWLNGDLTFWNYDVVSGKGIVKLKFKPVVTPDVDMSGLNPNCCTCDMPSNCAAQNSTGSQVKGHGFFHCAGNGGLAGAVFATKNAVMGGMATKSSDTGAKSLEYRLASSHFAPDGSLMKGRLFAYVPTTAIRTLYPHMQNADEAALAMQVRRDGVDGGGHDSITIGKWKKADNGADGVTFLVEGVTFSTPSYFLSSDGNSLGSASRVQVALLMFLPVALLFV